MVSVTAGVLDHSDSGRARRRITVLGATGSIGTSTLAVIADSPVLYEVEAVTAHTNVDALAAAARKSNARFAAIGDATAYGALKAALSGSGIAVSAGSEAVAEAAARPVDTVVAAIVGAAGLAPTYAAVRAGSRIALANKECLVSAGDLFVEAAHQSGVAILPVDSEHNAIFQILEGKQSEDVERIIITASGGPFRDWTHAAMARATPAEALKHPSWSMGPKITVDSATLINKGLELIEAHYLFAVPGKMLDVVVHPQSIVHGLVTFRDGTVLAAMGSPDMRTPIAHCLAWPARPTKTSKRLDIGSLGNLTFESPDIERFPALRIARAALDAGGWATNILSAANEIAVEAFLAGRLGFLEIAGLVEDTLARASGRIAERTPATIEEALALDHEGRNIAAQLIERRRSA